MSTTRVRRQEQEPATEEISELAPGVLRIQLPIRFTGLGHVNMYALTDSRGLALIDPGMPGRDSWRAIRSRLAAAGFRLTDVHTVVVTHSHPDHYGCARRLVDASGATLVTHAAFGPGWDPNAPDVVELDDEDGPPTAPVGNLRGPLRHRLAMRVLRHRGWSPPTPTRRVAHGEVLRLADRDWFAVHTPGHTGDHLCLHDPEEGLAVTGDHVLPSITPHVAAYGYHHDPLRDYLTALDTVAALPDVRLALPAHGHPFTDLPGRAAAIAAHHHGRLAQLADIGRALGPSPLRAFTAHLFPTRPGDLMATSETLAHLEHLRGQGQARRLLRGGELCYAVDG